MQAIIHEQYGSPDVLQLATVERPIPAEDEMLVRVCATGLNKADALLLSGKPWFLRFESGLFSPSIPILGSDVAGIVEAIGSKVTRFKVGDAVIADLSEAGRAGLAEWVTMPERFAAHKPESLSFEEAAAVPMASLTAYEALLAGQIKKNEAVMIHGASGGVGTFAIQFAKALGAVVTAVCSTSKVEQAQRLGADHVIDYKTEDFAKQPHRYDLILATNGDRRMAEYQKALKPGGRVVVSGGSMSQIFGSMLIGRFVADRGQSITSFLSKPTAENLAKVGDMIDAGDIAPVMDRVVPFEEAAAGLDYILSGSAAGKVVVKGKTG